MIIKGSNQFVTKLNRKADGVKAQVTKIIAQESMEIQTQVMATVPVDTGTLKRNVTRQMVVNTDEIRAIISANAFSNQMNYGYMQEYGNRYMPPKYFMGNAFFMHEVIFKNKMGEVFKR